MQEDNENELYAMHEKLNAYTMHHVLDGKKYARAEVTLSMIYVLPSQTNTYNLSASPCEEKGVRSALGKVELPWQLNFIFCFLPRSSNGDKKRQEVTGGSSESKIKKTRRESVKN